MNVSLHDVYFSYPDGVAALRGVSFDIQSGERVALVGQNGSGKTTLAKQFNGLLRPTHGEVIVGDWDTRAHTAAQLARRVGFLFQNPDEQIFKNRVADEVAFGALQLGLGVTQVAARVEHALERTGMIRCRDRHPYELLPSQRKWVAVASVLAMETAVLVLDEPTTGQDAEGITRMGELVESLAGEGKTIVFITHDVDFAAEHAERVLVMAHGRVRQDGPARAVFAQGELLAPSFVEPPQMTRLGLELDLPETVLTVDEFLSAWRSSVERSPSRR